MNSRLTDGITLIAISFAFLLSFSHAARSAVKSASTDGEATIYIAGNFTSDFDLAYRAVLKPGTRNKSWTSLGILLLGSQIPGPGAFFGLSGDPKHHSVTPYTYVNFPGRQLEYKKQIGDCSDSCIIELRGDTARIYAYFNNKLLTSWSRSDLNLRGESIQLNAEAAGAGDELTASLTPLKTVSRGHVLASPKCAFTTRGIEPSGRSTLRFTGSTNNALGHYVTLETGLHADKC